MLQFHREHFLYQQFASPLRHPTQEQTIQGYATSFDVAYLTARSDLRELVQRGLLTQRKQGTQLRYLPASKVGKQIAKKQIAKKRLAKKSR